jgi:hypothetical protein
MSALRMKIPLTPGQSVTVFSWMSPKETLSWKDILADEKLTFAFLRRQACISKELLYRLQPDIQAWVASRRVTLDDILDLSMWEAHPTKDLKADLGDLVQLKWKASTMRNAGVTYADMVDAGMTPDSMGLFGYTLYDWTTLGFTESDAAGFSAPALGRLFGLTRADVSRCFIGSRNGCGTKDGGATCRARTQE